MFYEPEVEILASLRSFNAKYFFLNFIKLKFHLDSFNKLAVTSNTGHPRVDMLLKVDDIDKIYTVQCKRLDPIEKELTAKQAHKLINRIIKNYPLTIDPWDQQLLKNTVTIEINFIVFDVAAVVKKNISIFKYVLETSLKDESERIILVENDPHNNITDLNKIFIELFNNNGIKVLTNDEILKFKTISELF